MNEQNYYRASSKGIVIDDDGRILLAKEDNGKWVMLGGVLDHGQDPITCLWLESHGIRYLNYDRVTKISHPHIIKAGIA